MNLRSRGVLLPARRRVLWGIAIYAALGLSWIVASDALVIAISTEPGWLETAQRYKGFLYVALTAGGLLLLVHSSHVQLLRTIETSRKDIDQQGSLFRQLHRSLGEVLWLATPDDAELLYLSPGFEALYGRPRGDLQSHPSGWIDDVHPDDRAVAQASHLQVLSEGEASCVYRIVRPDGSLRWVSDRKKLIVDDQGRVQMIGGIVEDISTAKAHEATQALNQAELERLVRERTAELECVNRELDAFTRTAAHDLKSPLHAVAGFAQLLRLEHGDGLGSAGRAMLAHIETATGQMSSLVNDLMSLSRASTGPLRPADVDLAALSREVLATLQQADPARRVRFEAPEVLTVRLDAGLARSLVANLLGNAWKFSALNPAARIVLAGEHHDDGSAHITLSDNGAGFDARLAGAQFQPFQRFHGQHEFEGTGIGLVTCQRIVQRHGGTLAIESLPGVGTTVHLSLPGAGSSPRAVPDTAVSEAA